MSTFEESLNDQDPDYVSAASSNQAQQKIYEENARNSTAKKITAIIEKEFSQDINQKQKEILQIQERLNKSLRTLHFLRYVIITDYYNRKQCELPQAAEASKQTRIHPAVKSLLGKSPKILNCTEPAVPSTSTDPRFLPIDEEPLVSEGKSPANKENVEADDNRPSNKKRKLSADEERQPRKLPRHVPPKSSVPECNARPSRGDRHKVYKRVIVGNISKWIPPDWRDGSDASHKWTMYVRGDKEDADIGTYVSKVRFFLHPSYRPHDVVEVTSHPFHLSRRGWGEFPLRVQLHFTNVLNKPMDIIHHLKLDRTCTGLQTLGSETLVDMWIYTSDLSREKNEPSITASGDDVRVKVESPSDDDGECGRAGSPLAEEIRPKKEPIEPGIREPPAGTALAEIFTSDIRARAAERAGLPFPLSTDESHSEDVDISHFHIDHDHCYTKEHYCKPYRIVRDGHVTTKHFSNNAAVGTGSSAAVEGKPDDAAIASHKCNGDIQPSSELLPSSTLARNTEDESLAPRVPAGPTAFRRDDPRKNSLDPSESPRATNDEAPSEVSGNKDTTTSNGYCKPSSMFNRLWSLQRAADNSHLKPLEISIPPLFQPSSASKRILLVKDKKLIPVDVARGTLDNGDAKAPAAIPQRPPVSVLRKPVVAKEAATLTLRGANSLLLNANYSEPALKIADWRDPRYNYSLSDAARGIPVSSSISGGESASSATGKDEKTMRRKITLGKDKHRLQSKTERYEAILRSIDRADIADTEALVRFAIRRLPIVTREACDPEYRRLHPYACYCEEDFLAFSVGKQRALEWHRAITIRGYLSRKLRQDDRLWSVKEILVWARLHGYTPSRKSVRGVSEDLDAMSTDTKRLPDPSGASGTPVSTYTKPLEFHRWLQTCRQESSHRRSTSDCADEIDVETVDESPCRGPVDRGKRQDDDTTVASSATLTPLELDERLVPLHKFVCDTAQEIGIKIAPEEIVPGIVCCAAGRAIMRVIECFVEDLIRSSLARAWERDGDKGCPTIITPDDVRSVLVSREEFDIFTNEGLGSQQQLSTTN
ncbi:PREDICTED: YEATS domain-containing protein 2 [Dinoponera quadriceps]|uniref:YEATS domain-containing protein 2 n=1 Tax=Dinoponera quadriceps TaxID=609295 RepID=A0A6P3X2P2_DINQU|nr:PREDICTED: YEATS domain-containing protein 2 [Dinoponera quadriceps]